MPHCRQSVLILPLTCPESPVFICGVTSLPHSLILILPVLLMHKLSGILVFFWGGVHIYATKQLGCLQLITCDTYTLVLQTHLHTISFREWCYGIEVGKVDFLFLNITLFIGDVLLVQYFQLPIGRNTI